MERIRLQCSMPKDAVDTVHRLAKEQGINFTEALRRAITAEDFLRKTLRVAIRYW